MSIVDFQNSHAQQVVVNYATLDLSNALVDYASFISTLDVIVCIAYH